MEPKFDLESMKNIVSAFLKNRDDSIWFSAPSRSIFTVVKHLACSHEEAVEKITQGLLLLNPDDFLRTVILKWGEAADEYKLENYIGLNWYVKFSIFDEDAETILNNISFHPIERKMILKDGKILENKGV